jgi:AcrR family transcriptional regulator
MTKKPRGAARRDAILAATLALIGRAGPAELTMRGVAREAGVPLAAVTYHFESKEALLAETLRAAAAADVAAARTAAAAIRTSEPDDLAAALAAAYLELLSGRRELLLAQYELSLLSARHPELRPAYAEWTTAYRVITEPLLRALGSRDPYGDARLLCAALDGLLLEELASPAARFEPDVLHPALRRLLRAFAEDRV